MESKYTRHYPVIVSMLMQGTPDGEIIDLIGISNVKWLQIQKDPAFISQLEIAREQRQGPMSAEEVLERATNMTPQAFEALETVIQDPRAGATARLKAAEMSFSWREELQKKRAEADQRIVYNLVIDEAAVTRMEDMMNMLAGEEGRDWLQQVAQVMPNSTA